jgi:hypothetical protein
VSAEAKPLPLRWLREGTLVYAIVDNPKPRPGMPSQVNAFAFRVQDQNRILTDEETERVATLATAAPAMLEALRVIQFTAYNQRTAWGDTKFMQMISAQVESAIAKAEGRQT